MGNTLSSVSSDERENKRRVKSWVTSVSADVKVEQLDSLPHGLVFRWPQQPSSTSISCVHDKDSLVAWGRSASHPMVIYFKDSNFLKERNDRQLPQASLKELTKVLEREKLTEIVRQYLHKTIEVDNDQMLLPEEMNHVTDFLTDPKDELCKHLKVIQEEQVRLRALLKILTHDMQLSFLSHNDRWSIAPSSDYTSFDEISHSIVCHQTNACFTVNKWLVTFYLCECTPSMLHWHRHNKRMDSQQFLVLVDDISSYMEYWFQSSQRTFRAAQEWKALQAKKLVKEK
jgi:hypothetical protein